MGERLVPKAPEPTPQAALLRALWLKPSELGPLSRAEAHGYWFWGPIALVITVVELLGVFSNSLSHRVPWPTISATVGHLESQWDWVKVIIVGLISAVSFHAISSRLQTRERGPRAGGEDAGSDPLLSIYDGLVVTVVLAGFGIAYGLGASKIHLGYTIYGLLAMVGIVIPSVFARFFHRELRFPSLFATFDFLRVRRPTAAVILVAGLSVLTFHLALYPWPAHG